MMADVMGRLATWFSRQDDTVKLGIIEGIDLPEALHPAMVDVLLGLARDYGWKEDAGCGNGHADTGSTSQGPGVAFSISAVSSAVLMVIPRTFPQWRCI